ncbi:MAG TPA: fumarylacetoacetate hydrolase family protein [Calidithermus sp.]|nr:fumarylacetoacetate hydrolase family protein [Calidithermus sp.]
MSVEVERLVAIRRQPGAVPPPSATRRLSVTEAYAVQDRLREALLAQGERLVGWKVGLTSRASQQQFGAEEPVSGFLLASGVHPSGSAVPVARFTAVGVEAEVALVLDRDLAGPGVTGPAALRAVAGALPALELIDLRFAGQPVVTDLIADGVFASALVVGGTLTPVAALDLALEGLVYEHNGAVAATATAAEVMGHPLNALVWLANHLGARGLALRAGDLVMTGSVSVLLRPRAGDVVRAAFTRLGSVSVRFT